ncbi:MAG: hypothetical protein ACI8ZM_000486 [Crocinitomix sp.]|jgi:hypothetical protein
MNEVDFDYSLFTSLANGSSEPYELQISTTFDQWLYTAGSSTIIAHPDGECGVLEIQLALSAGSDEIIIHDFDLGILPSYVPKWIIEVTYVEETTGSLIRKKKKNTEQAEIEAKPRPFKTQTI